MVVSGVSEHEAVEAARARLGLPGATAGRVWRVARIDPTGADYFLVVLGAVHAALGVAVVDAETGEVTNWASLPGSEAHALMDADTAIRHAGRSEIDPATLVWAPSRASRSPFWPLWRIGTGADAVYVDQQGRTWHSVESSPRGGGSAPSLRKRPRR